VTTKVSPIGIFCALSAVKISDAVFGVGVGEAVGAAFVGVLATVADVWDPHAERMVRRTRAQNA
jgi:hypothetical protein